MNHFLNVIVLYLILPSDVVLSRRIIKKVWIYKDLDHAFHFEPISLIKEAIFPFGQLKVEHSVEKRDLQNRVHVRNTREAEDIVFPNEESDSDVVIETQKKILNNDNLLTDIILTRVEFHKGKPSDAIKLHSITFPDDTDGTKEDILSPTIDASADLEAQESAKEITDPEPLTITEDTKTENGDALTITEDTKTDNGDALNSSSEKLTEPKADVEIISSTEEALKSEEENKPTEDVETKSKLEVLDTTDGKEIENIETEGKKSEIAEPIEVTPAPQPIEVPVLTVSPVEQPVYIPLYTDVKIPVAEVVSAAPAVVVVTEKEIVLPPVQTETTVIQTEPTSGLFARGSRFMLNISSRLLKKLLRLVSRVQARLTVPPPVEA